MNDNLIKAAAHDSNGVPPLEHLRQVFKRQRAVIVAMVLLCLVAALIYLLTTTRLYQATARFTAEPMVPVQADASAEPRAGGNFLRTQVERITSRSILALALTNPDLQGLPTFKSSSNRLATLRNAMSVDIGRADDVIGVSVQTPFHDDAPLIANAIVEAYRQYQSKPAQSSASDIMNSYQQQAARLHVGLDAVQAKMQSIEQQYGVPATQGDSHISIAQNRLVTLSEELTAAQLETLRAKTDLEEARKTLPQDETQPAEGDQVSKPMLASPEQEEQLRAQMIDLEARREELRQRFLPGHPALLAIARQIDDVNRQYVGAVQRRFELAQKRQQDLQSSVDLEQKQLVGISARIADYQRLGAEADRLRKSIENLESRAEAIQAAREAVGVRVDFIDPAQSTVQSHPRPVATLTLTLLLGLMLGTSAGWMREWVDDRLHSSNEVRSATGLPILGVVPQLPRTMNLALAAQRVALDPSSAVSHAYRSLRLTLDASAPRSRARTIVLTSADAGEGKTITAANLTIAMAQSGRRVLLIDAVLREPMLHSVFGVPDNVGLSTLLSGEASNLERAIQDTAVDGLWVLPGGAASAHATELLNSPAFPELLEQVADDYDHVIIDSPALTMAHDARIISASCDLTLLVVRVDQATRRGSLAARDGLLGVGAHLLGIVLTRVPDDQEPGLDLRTNGQHVPPALENDGDEAIDVASGLG